jgi:chromosomal replication initiation ATPase DnaA
MYLAHVACAASLAAVGRTFGRDRTTAGHACRRIEDRRDDFAFDALVASLENYVREAAHARCSRECRR